MALGNLLEPSPLKSALVAYLHYLCIILCFGALLFERLKLKIDLNRGETIGIILADVVYGLAGVFLIITGILRARYFGQGIEFYTHNPLFWFKIGSFVAVGLLSLYPTVTYILWAIPLSKNDLPNISSDLVLRFRLILNIEIIGFSIIPLIASTMARGIGLST